MALTKIRGNTQIMDDTIVNAQIKSDAGIALSKLASAVIQPDGSVAFAANQSMGNNRVVSVANPTDAQDAATKAYVDSVASGLNVKASVRAATTANGALASAYANGSTIDGVTLATGDRILLKNQTTGSENGIYTVNVSGAPTRAADADEDAEVTSGMFVFVSEGTVNADAGFVLATDGAIVVGTTALSFTQFSAAGTIVAGAGMTRTGDTLDVVSGNGGIVVNADNIVLTLDGSTLSVGASGLKLADLASAKLLVGSSGNIATAVSMSGDATISNTGAVTLAANILREADVVTRETPTGVINGSNTTFTLANTPISGTEHVYISGVLMEAGAGNDYTISGATITTLMVLSSPDKIVVSYLK